MLLNLPNVIEICAIVATGCRIVAMALPCRVSRLLLSFPRHVFGPGCYFEKMVFRGFPIGFQRCRGVQIVENLKNV